MSWYVLSRFGAMVLQPLTYTIFCNHYGDCIRDFSPFAGGLRGRSPFKKTLLSLLSSGRGIDHRIAKYLESRSIKHF